MSDIITDSKCGKRAEQQKKQHGKQSRPAKSFPKGKKTAVFSDGGIVWFGF